MIHFSLQFLRRAFSFDTLLKPLPPQLGQSIARNLGFFTRIFTQFFGNSQYSLSVLLALWLIWKAPIITLYVGLSMP
jgi:hypothetical protein